jgi:hypothetical protein
LRANSSAALADQVTTDRPRIDPVVARTLTDALLQVFVRTVDRLGVAETEDQVQTLEADVDKALEVLRPAFAAVAYPK